MSSVPSHLANHSNDRLGSCSSGCGFSKNGSEEASAELISEETGSGKVELTVYPNPSREGFNFRLESSSDLPVSVSIYDMSGKLVTELNEKEKLVTTGQDLSPGLYTAIVKQGDFYRVVKIGKIR